MKAQDYRNMDSAALQAEIDKARKELLDLRCQVSLGEEVHPHRIGNLRRGVARMMTVLRETEKAAAVPAEGGAE